MTEWIPCSERYPEKMKEVIVQHCYPEFKEVSIERYAGLQRLQCPYSLPDGEMRHTWEDSYGHEDYSVVAWMPLPEYSKTIAATNINES